MKPKVRVSHGVLAKTIVLLLRQDVTSHELADWCTIHTVTAQEWARAMHAEGATHIASWVKDTMGRDATPVYRMGPGVDAPRARMSRAEITRRYRLRKKGEKK